MADANFIESCSACRFFLAPHGAIGVCRRYPTHQNRHGNDWCGEYKQYTFAKLYDQIDEQRKVDAVMIDNKIVSIETINQAFDEVYTEHSKKVVVDLMQKSKRGRKPKVQE